MHCTAICYAPSDAGAATELRSYLEINCPLAIEDGVVQIGADLLDAVETGLAFDYVIVLLSPDSTQPTWPRVRWESILVEQAKQMRTRLIYVLLEECKFPAILRKETFFDLSLDFALGRRSLKRWLLAALTPSRGAPKLPARSGNPEGPEIEAFEPLADWPEFTQTADREAALAFAYARSADFEAVVWVDCARRGHVGVLGEVAHGLALRLEGNWEDIAQALREHCAEHRVLLVFENLDSEMAELINFGGKASVMQVDSPDLMPRRPLAELMRLFSSWKRNADQCLAALGDVESHLDSPEILSDADWPQACTLCSASVALLKDYGRLAEAYDLLARISSATQVRGDLAIQGHVDWETSWILDAWDQPVQIPGRMAAEISEPTQLSLFG
jgi:proteasome lid subunit RPN8/RPN11